MSDMHRHVMERSRARNGEDPIVPFLLGARQSPVEISVEAVERLDTHRLQILLVAQKQWETDGKGFAIKGVSQQFREGLELLGVEPHQFDKDV